MKKCRTCGKRFDVLWPNKWAYKKHWDGKSAKEYYCSWSCLRKDEKGETNMARPRKNTTPAEEKKEERPVVELVYDESALEEYRREQEEKKTQKALENMPLEVAAVFSRVLDKHTYKKIDGGMALTGKTTTLVLTTEDWIRFATEILQAANQMMG